MLFLNEKLNCRMIRITSEFIFAATEGYSPLPKDYESFFQRKRTPPAPPLFIHPPPLPFTSQAICQVFHKLSHFDRTEISSITVLNYCLEYVENNKIVFIIAALFYWGRGDRE